MRNETLVATNRVLRANNICNILPSQNSSLLAHWENIPETVLLNGSIGSILFILFLIMTKIAWQRAESGDQLVSQNIITFLYGYRDPELWYVIPRFEFLRREDRHHQHDLQYPHIYVPPKLPLANPIEIFAFETTIEKSNSSESFLDRKDPTRGGLKSARKSGKILPKDPFKQNGGLVSPKKAIKSIDIELALKTTSKKVATDPYNLKSLTKNPSTISTLAETNDLITKKSSSGMSASTRPTSFFYPSILSAEQLQATFLSCKLNSFFSMFFHVTDADIIYAKGIDAYEYLLFQRHLILIMFITNILCLGVILPVHWMTSTNTTVIATTSFQQSTIKNMGRDNYYYWAHIICPCIIVICSVYILNSYRDSIITRNDPRVSRRTLLIGNIPKEQRSRNKLLQVIRDYFSRVSIEAIQFVYDTASLDDQEQTLSTLISAKDYCHSYQQRYNRELMVHTTDVNENGVCGGNCRLCSFFHICCCYWPCEAKQSGLEFYTDQEIQLREKIRSTCNNLVNQPTEYAFVTFKSHRQARRVMEQLAQFKLETLEDRLALNQKFSNNRSNTRSVDTLESANVADGGNSNAALNVKGSKSKTLERTDRSRVIESKSSKSNDPLDPENNPHVRSIRSPMTHKLGATPNDVVIERDGGRVKIKSKLEGPIAWSVRYAPHPDNVGFSDLLDLVNASKYTTILLHLLMIVIFIFITTPNVVLSIFERISVLQPDKVKQLTGFQALIINYTSILLQITTTALLPALVTQISKRIPYEDSSSKDHSIMWKVYLFLVLMIIIMPSIGMSSAQALFNTDLSTIDPSCLFPTDNGAYFINYVISSIFLSTILELIKPVDILSYFFIRYTSRSVAELESGRQFIEREFSVALQHTSVLLVFSVVMTYAISCPLIAPVGLLYLIVKHSVDHYHLYYTYFTKKVDRNLQATIVVFVKVALLLMLFQTTIAVRTGTNIIYITLPSQIAFGITLAAFVFNCFFDCTTRSIPDTTRRGKFDHEFCACFYLPRVFERLLKLDAIPPDCISRRV